MRNGRSLNLIRSRINWHRLGVPAWSFEFKSSKMTAAREYLCRIGGALPERNRVKETSVHSCGNFLIVMKKQTIVLKKQTGEAAQYGTFNCLRRD